MESSRDLYFRFNSSPIFTYVFLDSVFIAVLFSCNFSEPSVNEWLIGRSVSCLDVVITPWSLFIIINLSRVQSTVVCNGQSSTIARTSFLIKDKQESRNTNWDSYVIATLFLHIERHFKHMYFVFELSISCLCLPRFAGKFRNQRYFSVAVARKGCDSSIEITEIIIWNLIWKTTVSIIKQNRNLKITI